MGCRERMLWIALLYLANDRAMYNPQTQTYDWPEDYFQVSHAELNLYCKLDKKAIEQLRNYLKQKGYIDFTNGERNGRKPAYKLHYLSRRNFGSENTPKDPPNMHPNNTPKDPPNNTPKDTPKYTPHNININTGVKEDITPMYTHRENNNREDTDARTYMDAGGSKRPCRYDTAWKTSIRARGSVAQRLIDGYRGTTDSYMHQRLCEYMARGIPPEVIEDVMGTIATFARLYAILDQLLKGNTYHFAAIPKEAVNS